MKTKNIVLLVILCILSSIIYAQDTASPAIEMATGLRSSGKIYIVIACIVVIFTGLIFYLVSLERRLKKLEKGSAEKE